MSGRHDIIPFHLSVEAQVGTSFSAEPDVRLLEQLRSGFLMRGCFPGVFWEDGRIGLTEARLDSLLSHSAVLMGLNRVNSLRNSC